MISDLRRQIKINEEVLVLKDNMKKIMAEIEELSENNPDSRGMTLGAASSANPSCKL